jgi:hypothetical protein
MITFKTTDNGQALWELSTLCHEKAYPAGSQIGPFNDFAISLGIIIDGAGEVDIGTDFESVLKAKGIEYAREDNLGVLFYENRSY